MAPKHLFDVQTCKFVCVTDLVPEEWNGWFYDLISEDAPFSWGDNNRTMVSAERFAEHVLERLNDILNDGEFVQNHFLGKEGFESFKLRIQEVQGDFADFKSKLEQLQEEGIYIELES